MYYITKFKDNKLNHMRAAEFTPENTPFNHRDWHSTPSESHPGLFDLKTNTGDLLCLLTFPKGCNTSLLKRIASAPELQDIAEMYHDHMLGGPMQRSMVFTTVCEILNRLE